MSEIIITVERVESVEEHGNADKLEIVEILGTQTVVAKGQYRVGQHVVFFPPDILIPENVSSELGVQQYLRHAIFDGKKIKCRVAACRLRGAASYGFITQVPDSSWKIGDDVTDYYKAQKYEPPVVHLQGDLERPNLSFFQYTDIQHFYRHPHVIEEGTPIRVTEKLHGTNCRVGLIKTDEWEFIAGSHKTTRKKYDVNGNLSLYWTPLEDEAILSLLSDLCDETNNVIIYCEIFGPKIQDLTYGQTETAFRVFDISVNGEYLGWEAVETCCRRHGVPTVPLLYIGPFKKELVAEYTCGKSTLADHVREGCVITPIFEREAHMGRVILKSVSADYLSRKGGTDA